MQLDKEEKVTQQEQERVEEHPAHATLALHNNPQRALQTLHALLTAIDGNDDVSFSHVLSQMQQTGGYDVWMNKDNAKLVAVPPLHRVVSKGSTLMLKQCVYAPMLQCQIFSHYTCATEVLPREL